MFEQSLQDGLCMASARGSISQVLMYLERGAAINGLNRYNRTALQVVKLGNAELVHVLLRAGADPTVRDPIYGLMLIHDAAREGFEDSVRALLEHGADVNVTDARGNLPLHLASMKGHLRVVMLLLERTALPLSANGEGHTALQLAVTHGKEDTARFIQNYIDSVGQNSGL